MDLLNSFRDGNDLNLRQLDNIPDAVLLVCRCTWAESTMTTRWDNSIENSFYQFKVLFYIRVVSLLWFFFGEIDAHPNVVFLQMVRFRGWVVMKNNKTCNALKPSGQPCLKPSGLIDWINCRLCNGWVHIKCAILSRTEARSHTFAFTILHCWWN